VTRDAAEIALHQHVVARRATDLVYERMPELAGAYGPHGRHACERDAAFHVRFLLASVAIEDRSVFEDYAVWTRDLLARFGIPAAHVAAAFEAVGDALEELLPTAAATALPYLEAGEAALGR